MRTSRRLSRLAAALLFAVILGGARLSAQSETRVLVMPPSSEVGQGLTTMVEVRVENVVGLYGLDIRLSFDPAVVQVADADESKPGLQVAPGDLLQPDFLIRNTAENSQGTVWFAVTQLNPTADVTGSGVAFVVLFEGVQTSGHSPLQITYAKLVGREGEAIPVVVADGEIAVVPASDVPTAPPGTPMGQPSATPQTQPQATPPTPVGGSPLSSSTALSLPTAQQPGTSAPQATAIATSRPEITSAPGGTSGAPSPAGSQPSPTVSGKPAKTVPALVGASVPAATRNELSVPLILAGMAGVLLIAGVAFALWLLKSRPS